MTIKSLNPQRTCSGCKKRFNQSDLLSITRLKNGKVVVNENRKRSGRSVYLCKKPECLKKARYRKGQNALQFGLKVQVPEGIWSGIEKLITPLSTEREHTREPKTF